MLGVAFFFLAVGTLYGSRWMIGFFAEQGFEWLIPASSPDPTIPDWDPSANAIYVQMAATVSLALLKQCTHTLEEFTTFG